MIDQGSSELNIIVGVRNCYFKPAIKAIYDEFITVKTMNREAKIASPFFIILSDIYNYKLIYRQFINERE